MRLPEEIILLVICHATASDALDTSIGCTNPVSRSNTTFALEELMTTKQALSLVSRTVHALCVRLLYGIVTVYDPRRILPLVTTLRGTCLFAPQAHGHFCRRLDIDIVYDKPEWSHGAASLWGLLVACPKLEILNISICAQGPGGSGKSPVRGMFHCPLSLLIQVADLYGSRLRRFELRGDICVYASAVQYLAAWCPVLEVLCVPGMFALNYNFQEHRLNDAGVPDDVLMMDDDHIPDACTMTVDERALFLDAHDRARGWRSICTDPVHFPVLHTLDVGNYANHARHWRLPALQALHQSFRENLLYKEDFLYTDEREVQTDALSALGRTLTAWTYCGPRLDVLAHLAALPDLEYLAFEIFDVPESACAAHAKLGVIDLLVGECADCRWLWVESILDMVKEGAFPALRLFRIVEWDRFSAETAEFDSFQESFSGLGVALQLAGGDLLSGPTVFHIPALLSQLGNYWPVVKETRAMVSFFAERYPDIVQRMHSYQDLTLKV